MHIRPANLSDIPQMLVNARRFIDSTPYKDFPYDDASMTEAFHQMMEDGLCFVVVGEDGETHLGGVGAVKGPLFFKRDANVASERFWWVVPDDRGVGVGKLLLKKLFQAAKEQDCQFLMMISLADLKVDAIYKSMGMTETEHCFLRAL